MTKFNIGDKVKFRRIEENIYDREGIVRSVQEVGLDKLYCVEYIDELGKKQFIVVPENRVVIASQTDNDMVNHPQHYNVQGRKECIDEMIEKYGPLAVYNFCMCNAYKYSYRAGYKDDKEQDLKKAEWYIKKGVELLPLAQQENGDVPRAEIQKMIVRFTVPGEPKGKGRPRFTTTQSGKTFARTPKDTIQYENLVKWYYSTLGENKPLQGQIRADIKAYYQKPKSMTKKNLRLENSKNSPTSLGGR